MVVCGSGFLWTPLLDDDLGMFLLSFSGVFDDVHVGAIRILDVERVDVET